MGNAHSHEGWLIQTAEEATKNSGGRTIQLASCKECGFTMYAGHLHTDGTKSTCPCCEEHRLYEVNTAMLKALKEAEWLISHGTEFGYIDLNNAPLAAHEVPKVVAAAIRMAEEGE